MTDLQNRPDTAVETPKPDHIGVETRGHSVARSLVKHVLLIALGVVMLYPLLWMLSSSVKPNDAIFREPGLIPQSWDLSNYTVGWNSLLHPFSHYLINSFVIVMGSVLGNLISCALAAYAFARLNFRLRPLWFAIMLITIMLPIHVVIVPQYVLFSQLGWINTFLPLIVPKFLATDNIPVPAWFKVQSAQGEK
jgi:multiple sugar transport system permease protein